jgi:Kef-type K+ transport system membrane component KefB
LGIIVSLILGAILGYALNLNEKQKALNSKFQQLGVIFLLFAMGASIGGNKKILNQLPELGLKALSFAILTVAGSIFVVYYISEKFVKKKNFNDIAETKGVKKPAKESV